MRVISLTAPGRNGIYECHRKLLSQLAERGCSLNWLCSGRQHFDRIIEECSETSNGEVVAPDTDNLAARTRAIVEKIHERSPDVVLCHALGDPLELNTIRYLSNSIPKILIVHSNTLASYRAARAVRDCVSATIAISPRIKLDLISHYGFREERVHVIPNGFDASVYSSRVRIPSPAGRLRILSHGRIDRSKGLFWIPEMLSRLARHSDKWDCTISGDGPDIAELKRRFALVGLCDRVKFIGWVLSKDVPELMNQHDVLLFPSKYEGFGTALIEAMAGGCVPVASRLPGITDWIIEDGVDGLLFPIGDVRRAVQHLAGLLSDRLRLAELRQRAQQAVGRFNLSLMAVEYYRLLCDIKSLPGNIPASERMDHFNLAEGLRPAWWYRIPEPIKDYLRLVREQVRVFVSIP